MIIVPCYFNIRRFSKDATDLDPKISSRPIPQVLNLSKVANHAFGDGCSRLGDELHNWLSDHGYTDYCWGMVVNPSRSNPTHIWVGFFDRRLAMKFTMEYGLV